MRPVCMKVFCVKTDYHDDVAAANVRSKADEIQFFKRVSKEDEPRWR